MMIANATGCSSIWGASAPSMPYTKNHKGHGPAWANSLFEDNAEYGLGMYLGVKAVRERLAQEMEAVKDSVSADLKAAMEDWIANAEVGEGSRERAEKLEALLQAEKSGNDKLEASTTTNSSSLNVPSGSLVVTGWAYGYRLRRIGSRPRFRHDVNVLVFDTEVYSNTGGQSSKSTPELLLLSSLPAVREPRKRISA